MLTAQRTRFRQRRGVALILILGMLGLLALIGVTFATFTGQARVGARNYEQSLLRPQTGELMDYALSQLIGDTNDVRSAIRGHSMARDMYGNDAAGNGYVDANPADPSGLLMFTSATVDADGRIACATNIPVGHPAFYGYNFNRWVVKFDAMPGSVAGGIETRLIGQTFEVLGDDVSAGPGNPRVLHLTPLASRVPVGARNYGSNLSPDVHPTLVGSATAVGGSALIGEAAGGPGFVPLNTRFTLDGRFLHAFNGPGMGYVSATLPPAPGNVAHLANMRYNGGILSGMGGKSTGEPNMVGMDEDYDAADLENWFLALQSADGKVIIPSFHRPGILERSNWSNVPETDAASIMANVISRSKILRPRRADGHNAQSFPDLTPSDTDGRIEFDVDNDGDGLTDSVWVDLGYPAIKDSRGLLYKPLFAFMVIGLNGRIPLNTAGNLQMRGPGGGSLRNMHTARLGTSPSEVDPTFGLQNAPNEPVLDAAGNLLGYKTLYPQFDNAADENAAGDPIPAPVGVNVTQLRNILAGTRPDPDGTLGGDHNILTTTHFHPDFTVAEVLTRFFPNNLPDRNDIVAPPLPTAVPLASTAIPGRWGEAGTTPWSLNVNDRTDYMSYQNPVRAGNSRPTLPSAAADGRDGNGTSFDYWPSPNAGETGGQRWAGDLTWPADYYDAAGDFALPVERTRRFVTPFDLYGDGRVANFADGAKFGPDAFGRVGFDKYFRPPGIPLPTATLTPAAPGFPTVTAGVLPPAPATIVDITNNPLHGFESYRNTVLGSDARGALRYGATPTNMVWDGTNSVPATDPGPPVVDIVTSGGNTVPTYNSIINSMRMGRGISEADELNLYRPSPADEPFGYQDLEWLYRAQDREGPSLYSRLADLAPLSFRDSVDSLRRRRLYSIDAWETNAIVWANDNPGGRFSDNSRFGTMESASLKTLSDNGLAYVAPVGSNLGQSSAPSLAHRDRKINLNYPLPVSNDPDESTRRKWITESYQLLKTMLPPLSLDTPEELAQLSQFLVNVIDFRDPDATMTRFTNPDVFIRPGTSTTAPILVLPSDPTFNPATDQPLVQYGMEYNPIAINEVLAYCFQSKMGGTQEPVSRFFIELVNTLTKPRGSNASTLNLGGFDYVSNNPYGSGCWDLIFTEDTPDVRPDPFTGQLLPVAGAGRYAPIPLNRDSFTEGVDVDPPSLIKAGFATPPSPQTTPPFNYFFTIGNYLPTATAEDKSPSNNNPTVTAPSLVRTIKPEYDPMMQATPAGAPTFTIPAGVLPAAPGAPAPTYPGRIPALTIPQAPSQYKWVCLRRPVNPFLPVGPDNPMVVVDSMRFHLIEGTGPLDSKDGDNQPIPTPSKANRIYSTQRFQPLRGGHAVLNPTTGQLDPHYGYSEQLKATPATSVTQTVGQYNTDSMGAKHPATGLVYSTLGSAGPDGERDTQWDYFAFNDRDFVSPAELLLVPGCPPGLFTKQFVEFAPYSANVAYFPNTAPPSFPASSAGSPNLGNQLRNEPRSYPYLVDRFFYTSASPTLNGIPLTGPGAWDQVRGPSAGGWYKMFEVFEVPSRAAGAVASAATGYNYDWFRQDVRPGQLNLNLIIDEEVFLGLMGNAGLRTDAPHSQDNGDGTTTIFQQVRDVPSALNGKPLDFHVPAVEGPMVGDANGIPSADPMGFNAGQNFAPLVVTEWEPGLPGVGTPIFGSLGMPTLLSPTQRAAYPPSNVGFFQHDDTGVGMSTLKAAFVDFLKIRHGGSGYMFGPLPEAPFRSLSYPDINYTVMRPAFATLNFGKPDAMGYINYNVPNDHGLVKVDAGVKNPGRLDPATLPVWPPAVPPRRLFQLTDENANSNAGARGEPDQLGYTVPLNPLNPRLQRTGTNLTDTGDSGKLKAGDGVSAGNQHPYWRSEWMQKMMNLSTVRTHQYAVWVTVGFFEVTSQGDPTAIGSANPDAAFDVIGREVGLIGGKNVRHRGFFIVDRLKLGGFDPASPGKFRDAVLYRRMIQ